MLYGPRYAIGMASDKLARAALASVADGRRTAAFEAELLALVPAEARVLVRAALALRPRVTAGLLREATAAAWLIERRNDFADDDAAVKATAKLFEMDERVVHRAAIARTRQPVNELLKELL
jgi:hypothetical protein